MKLETIAAKRGLTAKELSPGHWRISGGEHTVDYWPNSKWITAFVRDTGEKRRRVSPQDAVEMAGKPVVKESTEDAPSKRTVRQWIALLPGMKFAFSKEQREGVL